LCACVCWCAHLPRHQSKVREYLASVIKHRCIINVEDSNSLYKLEHGSRKKLNHPPFAPLRSGPKAPSRPSRQKQIPSSSQKRETGIHGATAIPRFSASFFRAPPKCMPLCSSGTCTKRDCRTRLRASRILPGPCACLEDDLPTDYSSSMS
jgi:hypothetical protein